MIFAKLHTKTNLFLKLLLYSFKLLGVATVAINNSFKKLNKNERFLFSYSSKGKLYNIFLIFFISAANYIGLTYIYKNNIIAENLDRIVDYFTAIFILLMFSMKQGECVTVANKLVIIKQSFNFFGNKIKRQETVIKKNIMKTFLVNFFSWFFVLATLPMLGISSSLCFMVLYLNQFVINAMIFQYVVILKFINGLFKVINSSLSEYLKKSTSLCDTYVSQSSGNKSKIDRLKYLHKLYCSLCAVCQEISDFYSQPMLFCVSVFFLSLTNIGYNLAKPVVLKKQTFASYAYFHYCLYEFLYIVLIVIITKSVTATVKEVKFSSSLKKISLNVKFII